MTRTKPTVAIIAALVIPLTLLWLLTSRGLAGDGPPRHADLSRLVVVGDSLSAGYQNGSLLASQQVHGYAALVAAQARVPLALPLIAAPGIPNVLTLVDPGPPPIIGQAPGVSTGRLDPFTQATDLAVPGHTVHDALARRPDFPIDSLTDFVLGFPGLLGGVSLSQVEWAESLAPTTVLVWIGNMDALNAAIVADPAVLTPVDDFRRDYAELLGRLRATGATLAVANIPDVTAIPFVIPFEEVTDQVATQTGLPPAVIAALLGIEPGDFVTLDAFALIPEILADPRLGPLPANVVLDAGELVQIRAAIDAYNRIIAREACRNGAALVDVHRLFDHAQAHGVNVAGRRLTTDYLGGLFSLDGIHPTNTGYAVLANAFIDVLDDAFHADIPEVSLRAVAADDPLILPPLETRLAPAAIAGD